MSRVYGEPVEVQTREDGRPVKFAWRGRLYTVTAVQEHWMINRDWWREPAPVPAYPELQFWRVEASTGSYLPGGQSSGMEGSRPSSPLAPVPPDRDSPEEGPLPPEGLPGEEAQWYQAGTTGVYELRRDIAAETWTLRRIVD